MALNLSADNYKLIRAAYTAADQTYGYVEKGFVLQPVNNGGTGESLPWETPGGTTLDSQYVVVDVVPDELYGGKFTIYRNIADNTILVNAMGTNGGEDKAGWYNNMTSYGIDQWRASGVKDKVFEILSKAAGETNPDIG